MWLHGVYVRWHYLIIFYYIIVWLWFNTDSRLPSEVSWGRRLGASDGPYHRPEKTPGIHTLNPLLLDSYWWSCSIYPSPCITGRMTAACGRLPSKKDTITNRLHSHAFQPRPSSFPALRRKQLRVRERRLRIGGADDRGTLPEFGALQPAVRELGLQLRQPRGQV